MKITDRSLLGFAKGKKEYAVTAKKYRIIANTVTIKRLGPSGSSNKKNSALEHTMDVAAKMTKRNFFESRYVFLIMAGICLLGR